MTTLGLWYYKWNGSKYEVLSDWNDQKFDYIIVTDGGRNGTEGMKAKYSGPDYSDGYRDARELVRIIETQWLPTRNYIIEIPYFYIPVGGGTKKARPLDYLLGWVDGAAAEGSSHLKGFYWSLENIRYIQEGKLSRHTLSTVSSRIQENMIEHQSNYQFIWIPSLRTLLLSRKFISEQDILEAVAYETDVPNIAEHFDRIFTQPGYYFANKEIPDKKNDMKDMLLDRGVVYTYALLVDILRTIYNYMPSNVSIELEVDGDVNQNDNAKYACDYVNAQIEALGHIWPDRAYYFDVRSSTLDYMKTNCPGW